MKTRIVQNEPNDPVSGGAAVTPAGQATDTTGSSATTPTNGFRALVRRRELVVFFALTYLIAWSTLPLGTFGAYAPIVSAISLSSSPRACRGWLGSVGASFNGA